MKRIICLIITFVLVFSNVSFFGDKASAENSEAKNAAEAYFEVISENSEYVNAALSHMGSGFYLEDAESPYVNSWIYGQMFRESIENVCYALCDISDDGVPELMIAERLSDNNYTSIGFYGFADDTLVNFDENAVVRNMYVITENNYVRIDNYGGAKAYSVTYYSLPKNSTTFEVAEEYQNSGEEQYYIKNGHKTSISMDEYMESDTKYKTKHLDWYSINNPEGIYKFISEVEGKSVPGEEISDSLKDSEIIEMQNGIRLLRGVLTEDTEEACDVSSLGEYDLANLMTYVGRYFGDFVGEPIYESVPEGGPRFKYMKISDMQNAAYKYFGMDIKGIFKNRLKYSEPENTKISWEYYGEIKKTDGKDYVDVGEQIDAANSSDVHIEKVYSVGGGLRYVLYSYCTQAEECSPYTYVQGPLSNENKRYGYAVFKTVTDGDGTRNCILKNGVSEKSFLSIDELKQYGITKREASNIEIDYSEVKDCTDVQDFIDYLVIVIGDTVPNDSAKYEIVEYIEYTIEHLCAVNKKAKRKKIIVDFSTIGKATEKADEILELFEKILAEMDINLNKEIKIVIRIDAQNANLSNGIYVVYDKTLIEYEGDFDAIRVVADKKYQSVYASFEQIETLLDEGINSVCLKQKNNDYTIKFIKTNGKTAESCNVPITFTLQSTDPLSAVFFKKNKSEDVNWGGQVDDINGTIEISTSNSGEYYVKKNKPEISDISTLDEEQQEAIDFMVSRGFFEVEDEKFSPYMSLSRYDFTRAIVSLFYELDFAAEADFSDVESSDAYYTYVASAQEREIVKGYEDNTFRGKNHTTREEVISIASRTLADKKGYFYPENIDEYVCFADNEMILGWDNQYEEIALAVREGLIEKGGFLMPQANINRADAALILYRLFNLLYEKAPAMVQTAADGETPFPIVPVAASGAGVCGVGAVVFVLNKKFNLISLIKFRR